MSEWVSSFIEVLYSKEGNEFQLPHVGFRVIHTQIMCLGFDFGMDFLQHIGFQMPDNHIGFSVLYKT